MNQLDRLDTRNLVLAALDAADFALIQPHLEPVSLRYRQVLADHDTSIWYVYFFESGLASMVIASPDGELAETLMIGREGFSGIPVVLGAGRAPAKLFVQVPGGGCRIEAGRLVALIEASHSLHRALLRYVHAAFMQVAHTAMSNASHAVEQRLARWLLMAHDRVDGDEVAFTHDFLSMMLNVRRPTVTDTIHIIEGLGLVRAERRRITIRDRSGLENLARAAYGVPEMDYRRLLSSREAAPARGSGGRIPSRPLQGTAC